MKFLLKKNSLIFAPMEGVTNANYRKVISILYPKWDYLCTDFIRVPSNGLYPTKFLKKHIGEHVLCNRTELSRTMVQILTTPHGKTIETIKQLIELGVHWLDLNVGCPSGTVVKHKGGSFWLNQLDELQFLIESIRKEFHGFFTIKTRLGFNSANNFISMLLKWEQLGVDAITVHGRTRNQLYNVKADWHYIKDATKNLKIPIIGNGDLWNISDVKNCFAKNFSHCAMIARGALKSPWLAQYDYELNEIQRRNEILRYFTMLNEVWDEEQMSANIKIKKIKELSRYIFENVEDGDIIKSKLLLTNSLQEQMNIIANL